MVVGNIHTKWESFFGVQISSKSGMLERSHGMLAKEASSDVAGDDLINKKKLVPLIYLGTQVIYTFIQQPFEKNIYLAVICYRVWTIGED